jgi:peptidoglycan/LPS O-acetylase OafA/YrhL
LPSWGRIKWLEAEGEVTSSFLAIFDTWGLVAGYGSYIFLSGAWNFLSHSWT